MTELRSLHPDGRRLVTEELLHGQLDFWPATAWSDLVQPFDPALPLGALDETLSALMEQIPSQSPAFDPAAAEAVHRHLPLSRRQASDPGPWRFLAVVHRPDVVRHRWEVSSMRAAKPRYWSVGTRPDSNAFARWWWIAELTRDGTDYSLTRRLFEHGSLSTLLFTRHLGWHRPLVEAALDVLDDTPGPVVERVLRNLRKVLSVVVLETCDADALRELLRDLVDEERG